jgi:cyclase
MVDAVRAGADAVLAASIFHFGELSIGEVKAAMAAAGVPVRPMELVEA